MVEHDLEQKHMRSVLVQRPTARAGPGGRQADCWERQLGGLCGAAPLAQEVAQVNSIPAAAAPQVPVPSRTTANQLPSLP